MGFFSKLFTTVFQPVTQVVSAANTIVNGTTHFVDSTVKTVAVALAPIPVVNTVLNEAVQQVDNATNQIDHSMSVANNVASNAGVLAGSVLDLNADDFNWALTDTLQNHVGGTLDYALGTTATNAVSSVFDFG